MTPLEALRRIVEIRTLSNWVSAHQMVIGVAQEAIKEAERGAQPDPAWMAQAMANANAPQPQPDIGWRVGRQVPQNIYKDGKVAGQCQSAELAAELVAATKAAGHLAAIRVAATKVRKCITGGDIEDVAPIQEILSSVRQLLGTINVASVSIAPCHHNAADIDRAQKMRKALEEIAGRVPGVTHQFAGGTYVPLDEYWSLQGIAFREMARATLSAEGKDGGKGRSEMTDRGRYHAITAALCNELRNSDIRADHPELAKRIDAELAAERERTERQLALTLSWQRAAEKAEAEAENLRAELRTEREARVKAEAINKQAMCIYCGYISEGVTVSNAREAIALHVRNCARHPLNRVAELVASQTQEYEQRADAAEQKLAEALATLAEHESEKWCFNEEHKQAVIDAGKLAALRKACEPFARACRVADALPPSHRVPDSRGLIDVLPGLWPTMGDLRALAEAAGKEG